jgi:hypothetical protein
VKPLDFEKIFFPVNAVITGIVFFLLAPTTQIYAEWFPDKKNSLWLIPAIAIGGSGLLWIVVSLNLPKLIERGIFEDRRKGRRQPERSKRARIFRSLVPITVFFFHMALMLGICISMIVYMRSGSFGKLLVNLP